MNNCNWLHKIRGVYSIWYIMEPWTLRIFACRCLTAAWDLAGQYENQTHWTAKALAKVGTCRFLTFLANIYADMTFLVILKYYILFSFQFISIYSSVEIPPFSSLHRCSERIWNKNLSDYKYQINGMFLCLMQ